MDPVNYAASAAVQRATERRAKERETLAREYPALTSMTAEQRLAVHEWLRSESDYDHILPSWRWAEVWIGNPSEL